VIARRILAAFALSLRLSEPRTTAGLDDETREHDHVPRELYQIHGRTAPELAAEARAAARRDQALSRMELDLSCDADFRLLAAGLLDELPPT